MLTCNSLIKYFGQSLDSKSFQTYLAEHFSDLTEYDIFDDYISSEKCGIELGFTNDTAVFDDDTQMVFEKGDPIFSHFNLYPISANFINNLPFNLSLENSRDQIHKIAGLPTKTREGYLESLQKHFRVDNYQMEDIVISFDYDPETNNLIFMQVRSSTLTNMEV